MTRAEMKERAKLSLYGNWGVAIAVMVVHSIIMSILGNVSRSILPPIPIDSTAQSSHVLSQAQGWLTLTFFSGDGPSFSVDLAGMLLSGAFAVGICGLYLKMVRGRGNPAFLDLFAGFQLCFLTALVSSILINVLGAIGTLMLIVPGIVMYYGFSQTYYILWDQPELGAISAMKASWYMMTGHKMELFILDLSFFPWYLACILVIPLFYVGPYVNATHAVFYENLRNNFYMEDSI